MMGRSEMGAYGLPDPILVPLQVGSMGGQELGGQQVEVAAMTATIDIDALPRLRAAFEKHSSGTPIDIRSQWHTVVPDDTQVAPLAFLLLTIEEFGLKFNLAFGLDEHRRSLAAVARTGVLLLFETQLGEALRLEAPQDALSRLLSIGVTTSDTEPIRRALQQRFDLPFESRQAPRIEVDPEDVVDAIEDFRNGAREGGEIGVINEIGNWPVIIVVDTELDHDKLAQSPPEQRWAHWSSVMAGPYAVVRLDIIDDKNPLAAWVWANPPQELVRVASSGGHHIAVIAAAVPEDPDTRADVLNGAPLFPVKEAPPAMRALLR